MGRPVICVMRGLFPYSLCLLLASIFVVFVSYCSYTISIWPAVKKTTTTLFPAKSACCRVVISAIGYHPWLPDLRPNLSASLAPLSSLSRPGVGNQCGERVRVWDERASSAILPPEVAAAAAAETRITRKPRSSQRYPDRSGTVPLSPDFNIKYQPCPLCRTRARTAPPC